MELETIAVTEVPAEPIEGDVSYYEAVGGLLVAGAILTIVGAACIHRVARGVYQKIRSEISNRHFCDWYN